MSKKILLVEDDAFIRDLYQTVLSRAGYEIEMANDGEEAVNMASYKIYDLILLDVMLPKLTGLEVLKHLRTDTERTKETPIYLLTNLGDENIINEAYKLGANGYLLKAKYLPKQLVEEVDKFFVSNSKPEGLNSSTGGVPLTGDSISLG
ncbi:response regulator [candidate division WWE3 bacterium]|nr:response regulator [candidate division WWE3 bacterium]